MCREDKNVFVSGRGSQFYIFSDGRLGSLGYVVFDYQWDPSRNERTSSDEGGGRRRRTKSFRRRYLVLSALSIFSNYIVLRLNEYIRLLNLLRVSRGSLRGPRLTGILARQNILPWFVRRNILQSTDLKFPRRYGSILCQALVMIYSHINRLLIMGM